MVMFVIGTGGCILGLGSGEGERTLDSDLFCVGGLCYDVDTFYLQPVWLQKRSAPLLKGLPALRARFLLRDQLYSLRESTIGTSSKNTSMVIRFLNLHALGKSSTTGVCYRAMTQAVIRGGVAGRSDSPSSYLELAI